MIGFLLTFFELYLGISKKENLQEFKLEEKFLFSKDFIEFLRNFLRAHFR